jgi:hypothetical protein
MRLIAPALAFALAVGASTAAAQTSFATASAPAAAPAAGAAPNAAPSSAAAWAGVYRIALTKGDETVPARVVMERVGDALDGTVLLGSAATALAKVRSEGEELRAVLTTSAGRGDLVLRATEAGVTGTLTVGGETWVVSGRRSS